MQNWHIELFISFVNYTIQNHEHTQLKLPVALKKNPTKNVVETEKNIGKQWKYIAKVGRNRFNTFTKSLAHKKMQRKKKCIDDVFHFFSLPRLSYITSDRLCADNIRTCISLSALIHSSPWPIIITIYFLSLALFVYVCVCPVSVSHEIPFTRNLIFTHTKMKKKEQNVNEG